MISGYKRYNVEQQIMVTVLSLDFKKISNAITI